MEAQKTGVRSGAQLEKIAASGTLFAKTRQDNIAASPNVVRKRLAQFASKCVNGRTTITQRQTGLGMPVGGRMSTQYKSGIENTDGTPRFIIAQKLGGSVLLPGEGSKGYNVQVSSRFLDNGSGGTALTTAMNPVFFAMMNNYIVPWASGNAVACPKVI